MARRDATALYFADDKDIYDLIISARRKLTEPRLLAFVRSRGLCFSPFDSREDLAARLARLTWGWSDIRRLVELTETAERRERVASKRVAVLVSLDQLHVAATTISTKRSDARDEKYNIHRDAASGRVIVQVGYTDVDWSRTRLQQRTKKELKIELENGNDAQVTVRYNAGDRGAEIVAAIVDELKAVSSLQTTEVTLQGIQNADLRTEFFVKLMKGLDKHELTDVSWVDINRLASEGTEELDLENTSVLDDPRDDDDSTVSLRLSRERSEMLGIVTSVALRGSAIHNSLEYKRLTKDGFYVSRAVWRVRDKKGDRAEIELEAEFADAVNCGDFRYGVRGVYDRRQRGSEDVLRTTPRPPSAEERDRYLRLLELAATDALEEIEETATGETS